ncbi:MAG: glutamine--fructose-6-phosphate aminotransferase, partial [Dethiobacteria bacterium]
MSGIVGYTGGQSAYPVLLSGLKKLEYRGYDSAGMALLCPKELKIAKTMGKISILEKMIGGDGYLQGLAGIGHIRWATHGAPSDINAHPHLDCSQKFAIVHNGIIENYLNLRRWLEERGHRFISETDSEVLAHLIEHFFDGDLFRAVANTVEKIEGSFAMAAIYDGEKEKLVCARRDCPLIIGLGEGENFVASDVPAFLDHTRRAYILENGEIAVVTADAVEIYTSRGETRTKKVDEITWNAAEAEKEGYPHFMIKEIMEQPQALRRTMQGRLGGPGGGFALPELNLTPEEIG